MDAIRLCFASELRRRWRAWMGLALLLGLTAGAVAAAAAGARRTDTAAERFAHDNVAYDAVIGNFGDEGTVGFDTADIEALPMVIDSARYRAEFANLAGVDVLLSVPADERLGTVINRPKVLDGRLASPDTSDEFTLGLDVSRRVDLHPGDRFPFNLYGGEGAGPVAGLPAQGTIVGIVALPNELALPEPVNQSLHGTPALYDALERIADLERPDSVMVRLRHGGEDLPAFERALGDLARRENPGEPVVFEDGPRDRRGLERSNHLQSVALWLVAGLLALGAVLVISQVLLRAASADAADGRTLRALGLSSHRQRVLAGLRGATVGAVSAAVAMVVAVMASPVFPTGLARASEPDPGLAVDVTVLLVALPLVFFGAIAAWIAGAALAERRLASSPAGRRAPLAARLAVGMPVAVRSGVGFAFRRDRLPVRAGVAGVAIGVVAMTAALTFGAGLDHLLATPNLYGWRWDLYATNYGSVQTDQGEIDPGSPEGMAAIAAIPGVEGALVGTSGFFVNVNGTRVGAIAMDVVAGEPESELPPILAGNAPTRNREVALGRNTMRDLDVAIDDLVRVDLEGLGEVEMTVVGAVVLPRAQNSTVELGDGVLIPNHALFEDFGVEPGSDLPRATDVFLRLAPGTSKEQALDALNDGIGVMTPIDSAQPSDLVNFGRVKRMPVLLGTLLATLAAATLAHALFGAVRREQRDLATLKAIGMTRAQVVRTVAAQASALAAAALVLGVPLGILFGRMSWGWYTDRLGVLEVQVAPLLLLGALVVAGFVVANLVAVVPARLAARTRASLALRAE